MSSHRCFWPNLHYGCEEATIYEIPEEVLTSPLDQRPRFSKTEQQFGNPTTAEGVLILQVENLPYFYSDLT